MPNKVDTKENNVGELVKIESMPVIIPVCGFDGKEREVSAMKITEDLFSIPAKHVDGEIHVCEPSDLTKYESNLMPLEFVKHLKFEKEFGGLCVFTIPSDVARQFCLAE